MIAGMIWMIRRNDLDATHPPRAPRKTSTGAPGSACYMNAPREPSGAFEASLGKDVMSAKMR